MVQHLFSQVLEAVEGRDLSVDSWLVCDDQVYMRSLGKSIYALCVRGKGRITEDPALVVADLRKGVHLWLRRQNWDTATLARQIGADMLQQDPLRDDLPSGLDLSRTCDLLTLRDALIADTMGILEGLHGRTFAS